MATNDLDIANVLKEVNTRGNAFLGDQEHEGTKKELLEAARNLVASLESPFEVLARMNWLEVCSRMSIRSERRCCLIDPIYHSRTGSPRHELELTSDSSMP